MTTSENDCGGLWNCTLPAGHNKGKADIRENHHNCSTCQCGYCDGGPCCRGVFSVDEAQPYPPKPKGAFQGDDKVLGMTEGTFKPGPSSLINISDPFSPLQLQLVVTHNNEKVTYHPVGTDRPWRIDAGLRELVIGKGVGRVMLPLCNILYYSLEQY